MTHTRILITGAAGFIGSNVSQSLANAGFTVYGLVRPGTPTLLPAGVQRVKEELQPSVPPSVLANVDVVLHLAYKPYGPKLPRMGKAREALLASCYQMNVDQAAILAQQVAEAGVKQFIFLSSAHVMGPHRSMSYTDADLPQPDDTDVIAKQKFEAEKKIARIADHSSLSVTILRLPLVYGPKMKGRFTKVLQSIQKGVQFPFSSVENKQSILGIENLVSAITAVIQHPPKGVHTYLLADPAPISTPNLIRTLAHALNCPDPIRETTEKKLTFMFKIVGKRRVLQRQVTSFHIDSSRFQTDFRWQAPHTTEEGLHQFVKGSVNE